MSDTFKRDSEEIKQMLQALKQDIDKRIKLKKQNKPVALMDNQIRTQLNKLDTTFRVFQNYVQRMEKNYNEFGITDKEAERRKNIMNDYLNEKNNVRANFEEATEVKKDSMKKIDFQGENFRDKYDKEGVSNQQLYQAQQDQKKKQDDQLDQVIDVVNNIGHIAKGMNREIDEQDELIDEMDTGIDKNIKVMEKTRGKMVKLMEETSNCCLITTIILEIGLLIVFLVAL